MPILSQNGSKLSRSKPIDFVLISASNCCASYTCDARVGAKNWVRFLTYFCALAAEAPQQSQLHRAVETIRADRAFSAIFRCACPAAPDQIADIYL
jgi:hypothetical protein